MFVSLSTVNNSFVLSPSPYPFDFALLSKKEVYEGDDISSNKKDDLYSLEVVKYCK